MPKINPTITRMKNAAQRQVYVISTESPTRDSTTTRTVAWLFRLFESSVPPARLPPTIRPECILDRGKLLLSPKGVVAVRVLPREHFSVEVRLTPTLVFRVCRWRWRHESGLPRCDVRGCDTK